MNVEVEDELPMKTYKVYLDGKYVFQVKATNEDDAWDIAQDQYGVEDDLPNITVKAIDTQHCL